MVQDAVQRFISASASARQGELQSLLAAVRAAATSGKLEEAAGGIRAALLPGLDYSSAQALVRSLRVLETAEGEVKPQTRVAVAGGYETSTLVPLVELYLFGARIRVRVYESPYGVFRQEIHDPASPLYAFEPKVVFIATGWRDLGYLPSPGDDSQKVRSRLQRETEDWLRLWEDLHTRLGCTVIQNSFDTPPWRILGNHDSRHPAGVSNYLSRLNLALQDQAPSYVIIHDVGHLAATRGLTVWADQRFYHYAKLPCAPECLPEYAHSVASLISASMGKSRKCLVLDLDNTLWGGVVGEDGSDGVRVGQGDPEAEAFAAFQRYAKGLRDRGILLAVCSKNDEETARGAFQKRPEMALRLSDFSCFVANWQDKPSNLRTIAERLNIGLDSLVFVDDDPVERGLVRRILPEVAVPEMPEDPSDYIRTIESHRFFQAVSLASEDLKRSDYYRADAVRQAAASTAGNLTDFLHSLDMKARIGPIDARNLERSAQLINKTNQFNLTTRRYPAAEVRARVESPEWITLTVSLSDRFGDNGLISVLMAEIQGETLRIDTWVMSCRVLKRSVEHFLLNKLCSLARDKGLLALRGEYLPTPRNDLVRNLYGEMGFQKIREEADGSAWWSLDLKDHGARLPTFVREEVES